MKRRNFLGALAAPAVACLIKFEKEVRLLEGEDPCSSTLVVLNEQYFFPGDIIRIPRTGENMLVTAKEDGKLSVVRGFGNSRPQPVIDEEEIWIIGQATDRKQVVEMEHFTKDGGYAKWVEEELLPRVDLVKKGD